jgi:hypothetical protein
MMLVNPDIEVNTFTDKYTGTVDSLGRKIFVNRNGQQYVMQSDGIPVAPDSVQSGSATGARPLPADAQKSSLPWMVLGGVVILALFFGMKRRA